MNVIGNATPLFSAMNTAWHRLTIESRTFFGILSALLALNSIRIGFDVDWTTSHQTQALLLGVVTNPHADFFPLACR